MVHGETLLLFVKSQQTLLQFIQWVIMLDDLPLLLMWVSGIIFRLLDLVQRCIYM